MGCVSSSESEAVHTSKNVEKLMLEAHNKEMEKIKLLLLGAGESGKSTIFKQMKLMHGKPLDSQEERQHFTQIVYINTISFMKAMCTQVERMELKDQLFAPSHLAGLEDAYTQVMSLSDYDQISPSVAASIHALWQSAVFKAIWNRRNEFNIVDSHRVFVDEIQRIGATDYVATQQDILLTRVRTSGVVTEQYVFKGTVFEVYDVGGQRNERKKWIHCFDGVTAVIFVAALSEYDQLLYEDRFTNRMIEAIRLFEEVCNKPIFANCAMILFLNKRDLFAEKISVKDIKSVEHFSDYAGRPFNYEDGCQYFLDRFLRVNNTPTREIFHHITCATDTQNISVVWESCSLILMRDHIKDAGFL